jgi:hypothetical protein
MPKFQPPPGGPLPAFKLVGGGYFSRLGTLQSVTGPLGSDFEGEVVKIEFPVFDSFDVLYKGMQLTQVTGGMVHFHVQGSVDGDLNLGGYVHVDVAGEYTEIEMRGGAGGGGYVGMKVFDYQEVTEIIAQYGISYAFITTVPDSTTVTLDSGNKLILRASATEPATISSAIRPLHLSTFSIEGQGSDPYPIVITNSTPITQAGNLGKSPLLTLRGAYWDDVGGVQVDLDFGLQTIPTDELGNAKLVFQTPSGESLALHSNGRVEANAVDPGSEPILVQFPLDVDGRKGMFLYGGSGTSTVHLHVGKESSGGGPIVVHVDAYDDFAEVDVRGPEGNVGLTSAIAGNDLRLWHHVGGEIKLFTDGVDSELNFVPFVGGSAALGWRESIGAFLELETSTATLLVTPAVEPVAATGWIEFQGGDEVGDTVTINGTTYTAVAADPAIDEFVVDANLYITAANFVAQFGSSSQAGNFTAIIDSHLTSRIDLTCLTPGTAGNGLTIAASRVRTSEVTSGGLDEYSRTSFQLDGQEKFQVAGNGIRASVPDTYEGGRATVEFPVFGSVPGTTFLNNPGIQIFRAYDGHGGAAHFHVRRVSNAAGSISSEIHVDAYPGSTEVDQNYYDNVDYSNRSRNRQRALPGRAHGDYVSTVGVVNVEATLDEAYVKLSGAGADIRLISSTDYSTPTDGDIWYDAGVFNFRENGVTKRLESTPALDRINLRLDSNTYEVLCTPDGTLLTEVYAFKLISPDLTVWNVVVDSGGVLSTAVSSWGTGVASVEIPGTDGSRWSLTVDNAGVLTTTEII